MSDKNEMRREDLERLQREQMKKVEQERLQTMRDQMFNVGSKLGGGIGVSEGLQNQCVARESSLSMCSRLARRLEDQAKAYRWLERALEVNPPDQATEEQIWTILNHGLPPRY